MNLKLAKPIVFFDIESTGIDVVKDRIVEISLIKINPDGSKESFTQRVNPTIPIQKEAEKIHGIKYEDVKDQPTFAAIAKKIVEYIRGCDLGGYNSNKFDIPLLAEELMRADVDFDIKKCRFVDVQVVFFKMEQRTLSAAYQFYCNKELVNAHGAESDSLATFEVLEAQLERYSELERDVESLANFTSQTKNVDFAGRVVFNKDGVEVFNFGKHKNQPVEEVFKKEPGFYKWIMNGDFPLYTKKILTAIKLRSAFSKK